ncbi:DEAD/DEAH box helicase [Thiothrix fructosivorans]|jgi:ATP-dependent RNA helicase DeaD|uniref:ATP-dependent RNA helicase DeaD n=1 Tax=Thiothrix fructosivorans TaxID=111770 RepID=A0A8B0SEI8_9GAMM|nr:DEAD/DEAH box helicase [Thiothrix fructosivorans]MBO0614312.1 DEAD/DEAH box helicase [Thiothrix fructosivorans]QTX09159.1 DEAD/DEAH box helicase [Thiothrix fructosivorans]
MSPETNTPPTFAEFGLAAPVLQAVLDLGYETPSAIQAETIPYLLAGRDVLGQAQTGTGKTAAFALPLLSRLDMSKTGPQILVLAPTRELAIQVAEAFQKYAGKLPGFHVMPIYGGQDYRTQFRQLERGVQVVVGTPGRVMDHLRRGSLKLDGLQALVLDEADEMLRMGFVDDIEWIMEQTPPQRQIALFSATMPPAIHRIAQSYLTDPAEVKIKVKTTTADTIRQRYWLVSGLHKLDALTRILEAEPFDAVILFVRTKNETVELADKLQARGYNAVALNGDIAQNVRERTIDQLKKGKIDILVATDVAARGLDVERISHVINYDIPTDTESYVHRIGRTGRAGRSGEAILFVSPRERHLLRNIERATRKPIDLMELPSTDVINTMRIAQFSQRITDTLAEEGLDFFSQLLEGYEREHNVPALEIAAALAKMLQGDSPLLLEERKNHPAFNPNAAREREQEQRPGKRKSNAANSAFSSDDDTIPMERFRIAVGRSHGVKPGNIVGAIANEAGLDSRYIGYIEIQDDCSLVDLPAGMPKDILHELRTARVAGQLLNIEPAGEAAADYSPNKPSGGGQRRDRGGDDRRPPQRRDGPPPRRDGGAGRGGDRPDRRPRTEKERAPFAGGDKPRFADEKPKFSADKPRFADDKPKFGGDKPPARKPAVKKAAPDKDKGKPKRPPPAA